MQHLFTLFLKSSFPPRIKYGVNSSGNPALKYWIPPHRVRGRLSQARNDEQSKETLDILQYISKILTKQAPQDGSVPTHPWTPELCLIKTGFEYLTFLCSLFPSSLFIISRFHNLTSRFENIMFSTQPNFIESKIDSQPAFMLTFYLFWTSIITAICIHGKDCREDWE